MSKKSLLIAVSLVFLTLVLSARNGLAGGAVTYKIGSHIADFAFKSDQGKTVKLSDYHGKTIVLTMFATW